MRIPDPLSALSELEGVRGNRTVQFFSGVLPLLLAGVMCAAFMRRPLGVWLFGALTLTGVGLGGWLARRVPAPATASAPPRAHDARPRSVATRSASAELVRSRTDIVLVLDVRPSAEAASADNADLLSTLQPLSVSQADSSLRLERRGVTDAAAGRLGWWTLVARADEVTARFVHLSVNDPGQTKQVTTLLRRLGASKRVVRDGFRTLIGGQALFTSPLKAVVICCSLADVRKHLHEMVTVTGRELDAIGARLGGRFPIYVVADDLQHVAGFAEFVSALRSRRGAASLDDAFGIPLDGDERTRDGLHRRLTDMALEVGGWRPSLLAAIDEQARRDARYQRSSDTAAAKALTYEFPRQLSMASTPFADFCWRAVAAAQGNGRGPVLRGVFFTGLMMPDINQFANSLEGPASFQRRVFAWNLLTQHIAGSPAEDAVRASH